LKAASIDAIAALLIGLLTLAVFLPALNNGFVNWDDERNLINNPNYRGFDWIQLKWMWTNHLMSHYVPLTWMTFGLDYLIWKDQPLGYHLTSVLLHAANAAVFFFLALAIFKRVFPGAARDRDGSLLCGAAFASLFFSLHPLRVESVAWATERHDVLCGLFYLLALLVYVRAFSPEPRQSMPRKSYLICLGLFVLALLSKEIATTLPAILLLLDVYPLGRLPAAPGRWLGREVRSVWLEKIPFLVIGLTDGLLAIYFGIRSHQVQPLAGLGWGPRIASAVYGMAFYVRKTLVPTGLSAFYPLTRFKTNFWGRPFLLSAAIVLSVTLVCLLLRRRLPGLLLAWAACVVTLLPVSGLIQNGFQIAADRYSYLACLGFALLAGAILSLSWQRPRHSRTERVLIAGAALLILFSLSSLTLKQIAFWRNSDTLWTRAIAVEPSFIAHLNLGTSLSGQGDSVGAIQEYRQANVFWPDSAMAHNNLGKELLQLGLLEEATQELRRAVQLEPVPAAYNSLARALAMQGKLDEAIAALRQALRIDPKDANAGRNLQTILAIQERQEQGGAGTVSRDSR
jgi:hypothetical protein